MEKGKLKKVIFIYENVKSTLDDRCQEWLDDINGMCSFMQNRNMNPFEHHHYTWKDENVNREEKLKRILKTK